MPRFLIPALLVAALSAAVPTPVVAQPPTDLLLPAQAASAASRRDVPARRVGKARLNLPALNSAAVRIQLFDDVQVMLLPKKVERPGAEKLVWVGEDEFGTQAVLTVVRGVLSGTVFTDYRSFEIGIEPDGLYSVAELDPGAFPTDDPLEFRGQFDILQDVDGFVGDEAKVAPVVADASTSGTPVQIDVMIVWTPKAETAVGGPSAMQSLALNAVANANLAYSNSGVNAQLRLVYGGLVNYTEVASDIGGDLTRLETKGDGVMDSVHTLREQYGADVVTLFGDGYRSKGYCGLAELMTSNSTSFAAWAFNVVDRACAVGNLSYAHEVGHNQGLMHDPANSSGWSAVTSYAYGYQDPGGLFRTVLSYGGATRVPYLSNPNVLYSGRVTGTSSQDNARALNLTAGTVAAFRGTGGGTTTEPTSPTPTCTYSVSTTSLSFSASGGSKTVSVTAPSGCSWSVANDGGVTWLSTNTSSGSGNGSITVTVTSNSSSARSATITVAGKTVGVSQQGVKVRGRK